MADPADAIQSGASPSLSASTAQGVVWMTGLSVATKALTTVTQIVLGKCLSKDDFGVVGIALAISAFPAVLQSSGLSGVLIRRQRSFRVWSEAAASLSVVLALIAGGLILSIAPIAAIWLQSPSLVGIMWVIAGTTAISSLSVVPQTKLQIDLRFRAAALISLCSVGLANVVSIVMAIRGFGAYSCVVPPALGGIVSAVWMWRASGLRRPLRLRAGRWRFLIGDSMTIVTTNLVWQVPGQGDRLLLGATVGNAATGVYFFGYNTSMQVVQLMAGNLSTVLAPTLSKLAGDPLRQARAFLRACRTLAIVGVPIAGATCVCAAPALHLVFGDKWNAAIPVVQLLSLGMMSYVVSSAGNALFTAQGRFRAFLSFAICSTILFVAMLVAGAWLAGVPGVAGAVSLHLWLASIAGMWLALRPAGCTIKDVLGVYAGAVLATAIACGAAVGAIRLLRPLKLHDAVQIAVILGIGGVVYLGVVRMTSRHEFDELRGRARALVDVLGVRLGLSRRHGREV
jgi:O-antigen/teichoic acid export membrane protein